MKKVIVLAIIFCSILMGFKFNDSTENAGINGGKKVRFYFYLSKPNIYIDEQTGSLQGAFYDYMEVMAAEMGIEIKWTTEYTAIPRMISILQGTPDTAIFGLSKTNERTAILDYTKTPFLLDKPCLVVLKDNELKEITRIEDIIDLKIGYVRNAFLPPFMKDSRIKFELISSPSYHKTNLQKLLLNRVDAVFSPVTNPILVYASELKIKSHVKILPLPEKASEYYVIFSKKSPELREKYNKAFEKLNGQELYQQKLAKYIN